MSIEIKSKPKKIKHVYLKNAATILLLLVIAWMFIYSLTGGA